ncbi:MAG: hypothetical protein HY913_01780 [Desulfomonile tiedjei]|nr:hypothetical protein [Desulfomonile tiedjei]
MKAIVLVITIVMVMVCSSAAVCQQSQMYDTRYTGPMNIYGQPVFDFPPQQRPYQQAPPQPGAGGFIPRAASGLYQAGEYFWGYMPAPVRGADPLFTPPPGSGQVITNFTPGTR